MPRFNGALQVIDIDGTPNKGAVVVVKLPDNIDGQKRQDVVRKARAAQVTAVVLLESETGRKTREAGELKLPTLGSRIQAGASNDSSFASITARKEMLEQLAALQN